MRPMKKRDRLRAPWSWCLHLDKVRCIHCGESGDPQHEQIAVFHADHYHAACALEVAIEVIEQGGFVRASHARKYGAKT